MMNFSLDRWKGKVAIVTGASSGIGAAIAKRLVGEGLQVVGLARRKNRMEELSKILSDKPGKLHPIQTDVTNEKEILSAFEWIKQNLGPIHILVNGAGTYILAPLVDSATEDWNKLFQLHVIALSVTTREAIKNMRENNVDGHIIHINSIGGQQHISIPGAGMNTASKHCVTCLTEDLRFELAHAGSKIKVTSISPGLVDTEILTEEQRKGELLTKAIGDGIILEPDDIVDGLVYILSTPPHVQVQELTIRPVGELL